FLFALHLPTDQEVWAGRPVPFESLRDHKKYREAPLQYALGLFSCPHGHQARKEIDACQIYALPFRSVETTFVVTNR
ncbi:hypothetical protein, partial [Dyadobacter beijingensis]|uniref:hypothetical protein n=1 Tax=Dyadobacter beijingensis TaxID=365489 RepID=UPI001B7F8A58